MNTGEKAKKLESLRNKMVNEDLPLMESNLVFGEGDIGARVMFIGEAPGQKEDELKRPFVGRSGQLLDKMLIKIGWKRQEVYISNIVKRRPPDNRDPLPEEISAYSPFLNEQIKIIDPKIIVTLGRFAMNHFLPTAKISRDHGKIFNIESRMLIPFFHPAAALRGSVNIKDFEEDFKKLPAIISDKKELRSDATERPTPPTSSKIVQSKLF